MAVDPHAKSNFDIRPVGAQTGEIFYVNNSGVGPDGSLTNSDSNTGLSTQEPLSTIAEGIDRCVASRGDTVIAMPGHAEVLTAQLDMDVAGMTLLGIGNGDLKPRLTVNGVIDLVDMSAANCVLENFELRIITTDAATAFVNVDAAGCSLKKLSGIGSVGAVNVVDLITVTANADDLLIEDCSFSNSVVAINSFLSLEGACSRVNIKNLFCFGDVVAAGIIDAAKVDYLFMSNVNIGVVGTTKAAMVLDSNPEGYIDKGRFAGTIATLASNANYGNLMRLFDCLVTEETNSSAQGALIPAVDAD